MGGGGLSLTGFLRCVQLLALAGLAGCGEKKPDAPAFWRPTLENPPIREIAAGREMGVPQMKPDDVIVAVNGICLTRRELDTELMAYRWHLNTDRRIRAPQKEQMYRSFGRRFIPQFVEMQALLWEARATCRLELTNVLAVVETNVIRNARHYGLSAKQYDKLVPGGNDAVRRVAEQLLWRQTYLARHFKPKTVVTDNDVTNVLRGVEAENAGIAASNAAVRARLEAIRARIVKGGEDFGKLADEFGEDVTQAEDGTGTWGEISRSDVTGDVTAEKMFALKKGEVSEILEDEDGYFIVKALEGPKTDEDGKTRTVKLARIWLEREQPVVLADVDSMKTDLQRQANAQEIAALTKELCKRVTVVYPHGTNFWNEVK